MAKDTLTKGDLVNQLHKTLGTSHHRADVVLNAVVAVIEAGLRRGKTVTLTGFGTFSVRKRRPRRGISIGSGQAMMIPARKVAHFTPSPSLNQTVR